MGIRSPLLTQTRFVLALLVVWMAGSNAVLADCSAAQTRVKGAFGEVVFATEVADTEQARARGLMHRPSLPRNAGMIFFYERPQQVAFWMRNTLIPLDMIFADKTGRIKKVHSRARPLDETPIPGGRGILAVLEINGGLAERYGIKAGDILQHPAFAQDTAVWPCEE